MKAIPKVALVSLLIGFAFAFLGLTDAYSANITSNGSGNWNSGATWSGGVVPGLSDDAFIRPGDVITVTVSTSVNSVTFNSNSSTTGTLTVNVGVTLTVTTSISLLSASGNNTAASIAGAGSITCATIIIGSDGNPGAGTTRTSILTSTISSLTVSGNLTIASWIGTGTTRIINSRLNLTSGTINLSGQLITTNEDPVNTSTFSNAIAPQTGVLNLSAASPFSLAGSGTSTITLNGTSAVVNYNGSVAQTVRATTYTTLKINNTNASGATLAGAVTVTTLTIGDVSPNSIFNDGGFQVTSVGTLNLTSGTFNLGSAGTATTWPSFGTRNISAGTTVSYVAGVTQTVSSTPSYQNLTLSGAGQKNANGIINVAQNLTNSSVFDMAGFSLNVTGTTSNTGTIRFSGSNGLAINSGTIEYYGASQTVASGTYNNLKINQSSGEAVLANTTTVNGVLTLTAGNLNIGSNDLTIGSGGSISVASPSASKMIIASGGSEVKKTFTSTGSFTFPIGDNTGTLEYSPVTVNVTSAGGFSSAYIGVSVADAKHPSNFSTTHFITRYWSINQSGITSCVATVTGTYLTADINGTEANTKAAVLSGAFDQITNPWVKYAVLGANTLTATGVPIPSGQVSAFTGITGNDPTVSISGGGVTICNGSSVSLSTTVSGDPAIIYSWSPTTGLSASTVSNPTASPTTTTTYTVTVRDGNGIAITANTTITVNNLPAAPSVTFPQNSYCVGAVITPPTTTGTALQWYSNAGLTTTITTGNPATPTNAELGFSSGSAGVTSVYVTQTVGGCRSAATTVTLTIFSSIVASIVSDDADNIICTGTNVRFTATPSGGSNYDFRVNGGSVQNGASNIYNTTTLSNGNQVDVIVSVSGCVATSSTITMTVNAPPTVNPPSNDVVCNGANTSAINFTGTGTSYTWVNNNASIGLAASGSGNIPSFTATNSGSSPIIATVIVTPINATCSGNTQSFTITVNPTPSVTSPLDLEVCNGAATGNISFSGTATAFDWINDIPSIGLAASGSGNIASFNASNATSSPEVATITVTPKYGTCTGAVQTFTITVNPTPSVVAPSNQTVCHGGIVTAVSFTGTATSFNWTNNDASIGLAASGSGNIASFTAINAGVAPKVSTITITPFYSTCSGSTQNFIITVNGLPSTPIIGTSGSVVCDGVDPDVVLTSSAAPNAGTYVWYKGGVATGVITQSININAPAGSGTYTVAVRFAWEPT